MMLEVLRLLEKAVAIVNDMDLRSWCYTEKATEARHRLERQYHACANRKKQCRPTETKPYSNATHLRKRQNNPTHGQTPSRIKSTHTRLTYTGTRLQVCGHGVTIAQPCFRKIASLCFSLNLSWGSVCKANCAARHHGMPSSEAGTNRHTDVRC